MATCLGATRKLPKKSRLSDPWLADDLNGHRGAPGVEPARR